MESGAATDEALSSVEWAQWRAFALMSRRVMSAVETRLQRDAGVSGADFEILDALERSSNHKARAKDLAEMLSWEKSRISHQVTRMMERGLVKRTNCEQDLRGSWIQLTTGGLATLVTARPHYAAAVRSVFLKQMDEDQAASLAITAIKVVSGTPAAKCQVEVDQLAKALEQ
jgi:DNA-binding MarR family transcriptional regulator